MEQNSWQEAAKFHGHKCPGLAIGYRAAIEARKILEIDKSQDENIVCISENDACGVDAIQAVLSCTVGKGNLIFKLRGKQAFTFFNRKTKKSVRLVLKDINQEMTREEKIDYILNAPFENIYQIKKPQDKLPEKARIFKSYNCSKCNEKVAENYIRLENGNYLCLDCLSQYTRGI